MPKAIWNGQVIAEAETDRCASADGNIYFPHEAIKRGPENELGVYRAVPKEGQSEPEPEFVKCRLGLDNGMFAQVIEGIEEGAVVFTELPQKTDKELEEEERER